METKVLHCATFMFMASLNYNIKKKRKHTKSMYAEGYFW